MESSVLQEKLKKSEEKEREQRETIKRLENEVSNLTEQVKNYKIELQQEKSSK